MRKERRQFGHIAVNPFDEFARRVVVVKFHVEMQSMFGEFGAERVGGCPCDVFAEPRDSDGDDLLSQRDTDESERGPREGLKRCAREGRVYELAHDLRRENPQADTAEEQRGEQEEPSALWADVGGEEVVVGGEGEVHGKSVGGKW